MNREKLGKTRNHAILKTEKPLGTRLERLGGGEGLSGFLSNGPRHAESPCENLGPA